MKRISEQNENASNVKMKEQMKKFLIKSLYGFLTVLMFGLGRRVGIFDYLQGKAKSVSDVNKVSSVIFTIDELVERLNLDWNYVDAWTHTALECGLLEIEESCEKCLRTAPYVYELLINRDQPNYVGDPLGAFYYLAPYQDSILKSFSKNSAIPNIEFTDEVIHDINRMSARFGTLIERIFSKNNKEFCDKLQNKGNALEAGCGYGYNLQVWARKYENVQFVGIDIDPNAIKFAKEMVKKIIEIANRVEALEKIVRIGNGSAYCKSTFIELSNTNLPLNVIIESVEENGTTRTSSILPYKKMMKDVYSAVLISLRNGNKLNKI